MSRTTRTLCMHLLVSCPHLLTHTPRSPPLCTTNALPLPALPRLPSICPTPSNQDRPLAWERWAYTFAQLRQLAALAPHLPTEAPQLKPATYGMVLSSLLLHPSGGWVGGRC